MQVEEDTLFDEIDEGELVRFSEEQIELNRKDWNAFFDNVHKSKGKIAIGDLNG